MQQAIEITTKSQEASARFGCYNFKVTWQSNFVYCCTSFFGANCASFYFRHDAERKAQEAEGLLERQKLKDEIEAEKAR